jgi:hypothetical protein
MRPAFRTGPLKADPDLLQAIPRMALIAAIVRHATTSPIHGEAVMTHHEEGETRFQLETDVARQRTLIRFSEGRPCTAS